MTDIFIQTEYIKLDSFLKLAGVCQTGGESKMRILDEEFCVNGQLCTMRGKKLRTDDVVCFVKDKTDCYKVCEK